MSLCAGARVVDQRCTEEEQENDQKGNCAFLLESDGTLMGQAQAASNSMPRVVPGTVTSITGAVRKRPQKCPQMMATCWGSLS